MKKLSQRMQLIYDQLLPGKPVWDFCCDHGYLGLNAFESGIFPEVHFVDQVPQIIEQLKKRFNDEYLQQDLSQKAFFYDQPAESLSISITGTVVIAGVGAHTIRNILSGLIHQNILQADLLILVPQRDEDLFLNDYSQKIFENRYYFHRQMSVMENNRERNLLLFAREHVNFESGK